MPGLGVLIAASAAFVLGAGLASAEAKPIAAPQCMTVFYCEVACPVGDDVCLSGCALNTPVDSVIQADILFGCIRQNCPGSDASLPFEGCPWEMCGGELMDCNLAYWCSPAGGNCPPGMACLWVDSLNTQCFDSMGLELGQDCDPSSDQVVCADGLYCIDVLGAGEAVCTKLCQQDADCVSGDYCAKPLLADVPDSGLCVCNDKDNDGVCGALDCDQGEPAMFPGATEVCDGLDNDCDGLTDEECFVAPDQDNPESDWADVVSDIHESDAAIMDISMDWATPDSNGGNDQNQGDTAHVQDGSNLPDGDLTKDLGNSDATVDSTGIPSADVTVVSDTSNSDGKGSSSSGCAASATMPAGALSAWLLIAAMAALAVMRRTCPRRFKSKML